MRDIMEIIKSKDGWGGYNYELLIGKYHRERIYRPESSAPYIMIDGERINLLPSQRAELKKIMEGA